MKNVQTITRFQIDEPNDLNEFSIGRIESIIVRIEGMNGEYGLCHREQIEFEPENESESDFYLYNLYENYIEDGVAIEDFNLNDLYFEYVND